MKIQALETAEVLRRLVTSGNGLTEEEAKRRLSEFGFNEIREVKKKPLLIRFFGQLTHFLAILLWIGAGLAFLSEFIRPEEGMLTLGFAIVSVIFINAVFTFTQEYRAEKALEELKKLLPFYVHVIRDGKRIEILAREVVPGDMILISAGDKIPADSRLIESTVLKVNNAPLTGESEPMIRDAKPFSGEFIESPNIAFAGTTVLSGSGKAVAFATGMRTEFGRIAHLTGTVEAGLSPLQKEIIKVTRIVAFIATIMGIAFFAIGYLIGRTFWENYLFAIGIIIANVPEGLLPTVTLSLAMGSQRMAKKKALIKTLTSVETLGSVTVICSDKTGTITQNKMEVKRTWTPDSRQQTTDSLIMISSLCNNAKFIDGEYIGDPTETALLKYAREKTGDLISDRISEIPFDSERKRMTTVNKISLSPPFLKGKEGIFALTKGALENVFPLCSHILIKNREELITDEIKALITDSYHSLMDKGLRVLSFAYSELRTLNSELEENMVFVGMIGLEDPPRQEVPDAIKKCQDAGIKVIMITGDGSRTALAIAREVGLVKGNPVIIEGHELIRMNDRELIEKLCEKEIIFARMTPKHKMRIVSILKEEGERVAVTGDGVNDAPALKKADIGIAMGITGTDVAKEASDMVLLDDNFATIVNAVEEGRGVYENIRKFVSYIFSSNIPEIVPYLSYVLLRIPLPLTIMQILAVDLGTDMLPALALGAEKPTEELMKRPPRDPKERLLNLKLVSRAYFFLGPIEAVAGLFGFFYVLKVGGWKWGEMLSPDNLIYMQATTACLTAIVITQIANVFACRSFKESVFSIGLFSNRLIFAGIAFEIVLQLFIVYHPWGNKIFSTAPIASGIWLLLIPFAVILFLSEEMRKLISRRYLTPSPPSPLRGEDRGDG